MSHMLDASTCLSRTTRQRKVHRHCNNDVGSSHTYSQRSINVFQSQGSTSLDILLSSEDEFQSRVGCDTLTVCGEKTSLLKVFTFGLHCYLTTTNLERKRCKYTWN
jgi:hypothetical protein